jgi:hypothetical protein
MGRARSDGTVRWQLFGYTRPRAFIAVTRSRTNVLAGSAWPEIKAKFVNPFV